MRAERDKQKTKPHSNVTVSKVFIYTCVHSLTMASQHSKPQKTKLDWLADIRLAPRADHRPHPCDAAPSEIKKMVYQYLILPHTHTPPPNRGRDEGVFVTPPTYQTCIPIFFLLNKTSHMAKWPQHIHTYLKDMKSSGPEAWLPLLAAAIVASVYVYEGVIVCSNSSYQE